MATAIITIVASVLSLVAAWFLRSQINVLMQKWSDWQNQKQSDSDKLRSQLIASTLQKDNDNLLKLENDKTSPK